jgi:hypothetical protein
MGKATTMKSEPLPRGVYRNKYYSFLSRNIIFSIQPIGKEVIA